MSLTMKVKRRLCALVVSISLSSAVLSQPALQPIPEIATDELSIFIETVIFDAQTRLDVAQASGATGSELAVAYGHLGDVLLVHGLMAPAQVAYENAQTLEPQRLDWPYLLSVIAIDQGNAPEALRHLGRALAIDPWDRASLIRRGRLYLANGETALAQKDFEKTVQLNPESAAALAGLGEAALQQQDFDKAVTQLEAALSRQPAATRLIQPLALAYRGLGMTDQARTMMGTMGDRDVAFVDPVMDRVREKSQSPQFYQESALQAAEMGDLINARALLVQALSLAPNDPLIVTNYGEVLAREGLLSEAKEAFVRLVELQPNEPDAWFYLAQTEELLGDLDGAQGAYTRMLSLSEDDFRANQGLAHVALAKGQYRRAADAFDGLRTTGQEEASRYLMAYWYAIALIGLEAYEDAMSVLDDLETQSSGADRDVIMAKARLMASVVEANSVALNERLAQVTALYNQAPDIESAATLAMIHAKLGQFLEAQDYQAQAMFEALREGFLDQRPDLKEEMDWYRQQQPATRPFGKGHAVFSHRTIR